MDLMDVKVNFVDISSPMAMNHYPPPTRMLVSIDWFKGKITGKSHISWESLWFPVDFPFN